MGQYFLAVCPDRLEYVKPDSFGGGLKAGEILYSSAGQMDAHAILIADPGIAPRPADLRIPRLTGAWAGLASFYIGDYGDDGDAPRWPWKISEGSIYHEIQHAGADVASRLVAPIARTHGLYPGISESTIRYQTGEVETYRRTEYMAVRPLGDDRIEIDEEPYSGNPHYQSIIAKARPKVAREKQASYRLDARAGCRRLVANLDRREYIDPRALAEIPTLAGILRGQAKVWRADPPLDESDAAPPSTLQLMSCALFTPGSDDACHGGWRTDRLLITAERSRSFPTTHDIEADAGWKDVTQHLADLYRIMAPPRNPSGKRLLDRHPDWARFHRTVESQRYTWSAA